MEWKWAKHNEKDLAKFVTEKVKQLFPQLPVDPLEYNQNAKGRRKLIKAIYEKLTEQNITYAYEKYQPEKKTQQIRTPSEILQQPKEGTCLDLSILFCGLCFSYDLLPLLIVIEGHALAAVSLRNQRKEYNNNDALRNLFDTRELFQGQDNLESLKAWIEDEAYIAVDCTGFAHTKVFTGEQPEEKERQADGTLSFDRACEAGEEQLSNPTRTFQFAIDIATAKYIWKIGTLEIPNLSATVAKITAENKQEFETIQGGKVTGIDASNSQDSAELKSKQKVYTLQDGEVIGIKI